MVVETGTEDSRPGLVWVMGRKKGSSLMGTGTKASSDGMAGRHVLIVEDELLIALEIERCVQLLGCVVLGPVGSVGKALRLVADSAPDAAILDVNLRGELVTPVARMCHDRGIPFILLTGYGRLDLEEPLLQDAPRIWKPFDSASIGHSLAVALNTDRDA